MGTKLLLADDSITIQKVVGIIFANEDYELTVVDNGITALEKAREVRPDVLLLDALMPGKSGYEVCAEVRRDPLLKDVPLLLLVGAFEPFDEEKARNCGADDFITKPFESQSLIDKVKSLIDVGATRMVSLSPLHEDFPSTIPSAETHTFDTAARDAVSSEEQELPAGAANLVESFKGYVHIGSTSTPPPETVAVVEQATAPEAERESVILLSSVDIVEATPDDDPWGIFAEEVAEGESIQFGEVVDEQDIANDDIEELEPFTLMDDETLSGELTSYADTDEESGFVDDSDFAEDELLRSELSDDLALDDVTAWTPQTVGESISLGATGTLPEPALSEEPACVADVLVADQESIASFSADEDLLTFAPDEELMPVSEAASEAVVPAVECVVADHVPLLTEEQLTLALSRVSRDVIEKIVWEVVPDLAEQIIKEEIRKIKEGMTR
jgi:CheY-like chemotaxis protein